MRLLLATLLISFAGCPDDEPGRADGEVSPDVPDTIEAEAPDVPDAPDDIDGEDGDDADDGDDGDDGDTTPEPGGWLSLLESASDLATLSIDGGEVKYLARVAGKTPPAPLTEECYFQDMHRWQWHLEFLRSFPEFADMQSPAYSALVLRRPSRTLWGGSVRPWPAVPHPRTQALGVVSYAVYGEQLAGSVTVQDIIEVDQTLARCMPFAADLLVYVPTDAPQKQLVAQNKAALNAAGVDVLMPEQLRQGLAAEAYVEGEGYGTLLVVPADGVVDEYGPRDIVIAPAAPNDISIVAGLVTRDPQNVHSHVNLRLAEKAVPSASVGNIYDNALIAAYAGKLVHLVVSDAGVEIQPARLEDAEAFWESRRPPIATPVSDLTVTALEGFATLTNADAIAYGVKAANLGELHQLLAEEHRVEGFGIPFSYYAAFVEADPGPKTLIAEVVADPRMATDRLYAEERLDSLREAIEDAPFPDALLQTIAARLREVFGEGVETTRIRFRSSTNAEDLDVISGAGLYDSKSGCLADDFDADTAGPSLCLGEDERAFMEAEVAARKAELAAHPERTWLAAIIDDFAGDLTKEKTVARAVRKVWASLWNKRAYDERAYYGIDHRDVFMGIAVDPSFVLETANAVAVTNLPTESPSAAGSLYRLVSQTGWLSVVRPEDPLAVAEVLTFLRDGAALDDVRVLVPSTLVPEGETVWSEAELATIGALLYQVQDDFAAEVYPDTSASGREPGEREATTNPLSLDIEIKRTADGRIVIKQVRPYIGLDLIGE